MDHHATKTLSSNERHLDYSCRKFISLRPKVCSQGWGWGVLGADLRDNWNTVFTQLACARWLPGGAGGVCLSGCCCFVCVYIMYASSVGGVLAWGSCWTMFIGRGSELWNVNVGILFYFLFHFTLFLFFISSILSKLILWYFI
jgi:hypothetical protein